MTLILDASAALSWSIADETDGEAIALLKEVRARGGIVPPLWLYEMENGLQNAIRRKRLSETEAMTIRNQLTKLPIRVADASERVVFYDTLSLANRFNISVYDAVYLDVAVRYKGNLVTRDRRLADVASALGVGAGSRRSQRKKNDG